MKTIDAEVEQVEAGELELALASRTCSGSVYGSPYAGLYSTGAGWLDAAIEKLLQEHGSRMDPKTVETFIAIMQQAVMPQMLIRPDIDYLPFLGELTAGWEVPGRCVSLQVRGYIESDSPEFSRVLHMVADVLTRNGIVEASIGSSETEK